MNAQGRGATIPAVMLRSLIVAAVLLTAAPALAQQPTDAARASEIVRDLERSTARVQRLLADTRRRGDEPRARCVDDQLSQLNATRRLALERHQRASRLERQADREMAARERALLARLSTRARELERAARRCVDPAALEPDRTRVTVLIDPDVPTDAIIEPPAERRAVFAY